MSLSVDLYLEKLAKGETKFTLDITETLPLSQGIVGVFGASGAGKSSLLRCIAGLEDYQGEVVYQEQMLVRSEVDCNPAVYQGQNNTLFPHLTVAENLQLVKRHGRWQSHDFTLSQVASECVIEHLLQRPIQGLSGGEVQRVNLARTLLCGKPLLLLDEPFSANDWQRKQTLLSLLVRVQRDTEKSIVLVSHSLDELAYCCEYLICIDNGRVTGFGDAKNTVKQLSQQQLNSEFSLLSVLPDPQKVSDGLGKFTLTGADSQQGCIYAKYSEVLNQRIKVSADKVSLAKGAVTDISLLNQLSGTVCGYKTKVDSVLVDVDISGQVLLADVSAISFERLGLKQGDEVVALFKAI